MTEQISTAEAYAGYVAAMTSTHPGMNFSAEEYIAETRNGFTPALRTDDLQAAIDDAVTRSMTPGTSARVCALGACLISFRDGYELYCASPEYVTDFRKYARC